MADIYCILKFSLSRNGHCSLSVYSEKIAKNGGKGSLRSDTCGNNKLELALLGKRCFFHQLFLLIHGLLRLELSLHFLFLGKC